MLRTAAPGRHSSGRHSRPAKADPTPAKADDRNVKWHGPALTLLLAVTAAGFSFAMYPAPGVTALSARHGFSVVTVPNLANLLGQGEVSSFAPLPAPIVTATASATPKKAKAKPKPKPAPSHSQPASSTSSPTSSSPVNNSGTALGGAANYAGSLELSESGSQLTSWNQTSSFCSEQSWEVGNGTVSTDSSGDATETVNGSDGSCVALVSPQSYSSAVIEADIDFPAVPGSSGTIADWTSFWLTNGAAWPQDGELDAVEAEPVTGVNAVAWHSGSNGNEFSASTDDFFDTKLPKNGPNLTPGWHTVDIVYTQGFMAVYYDGQEYTTYNSGNVTGDALNIYITTSVTPNISSVQQQLGGPPKNSDSSPATVAVKYLKVWSYKG
jgi:hypothetical protein